MPTERCDYCNLEVVRRGVDEQEWIHITGSAFCMNTLATVNGSRDPRIRFHLRQSVPEPMRLDRLVALGNYLAELLSDVAGGMNRRNGSRGVRSPEMLQDAVRTWRSYTNQTPGLSWSEIELPFKHKDPTP